MELVFEEPRPGGKNKDHVERASGNSSSSLPHCININVAGPQGTNGTASRQAVDESISSPLSCSETSVDILVRQFWSWMANNSGRQYTMLRAEAEKFEEEAYTLE